METLESGAPAPTCPTSTLGDLLTLVRVEAGLSVDQMGRSGPLTVETVRELEAGRYDLPPADLAAVLDRYGVPSIGPRFARNVVVISLEEGWVSLRQTRRFWEPTADADQNLLRYLSLLYRHLGLSFGERVPVRSVDLALLRASLALRRDEVESHLDRLGVGLSRKLGPNRNLLAFAAAGIAVAAGAIVLLPAASVDKMVTGRPASPAGQAVPHVQPADDRIPAPASASAVSEPQIDIGTAVVIHRSPSGVPQLIESNPPALLGSDPQIDIGTALVIERAGASPAPNAGDGSSPKSSRGPPNGAVVEPKGSK